MPSSSTAGATPSATPKADSPARIAWRSAIAPVSEVVVVGDVGAVYTLRKDHLWLVGLDMRTGKELWSHRAVPSAWTPGVELHVDVIRNQFVHLHGPDIAQAAAIVVRDPTTGQEVARSSDSYRFLDHPEECPDGHICANADSELGSRGRVTFDPKTGQTSMTSSGTDGQQIASDLVRSTGPVIHRVERGRRIWTVDLSQVLGPGYSTDHGWNFKKTSHGYVGTVRQAGTDANGWSTLHHPSMTTVLLDLHSGRILWQRKGFDTLCFSGAPGAPSKDAMVACQWKSGTTTFHGSIPDTEGATGDAVSIDIKTGRTLWTAPLGDMTFKDPFDATAVSGGLVVNTSQGPVGFRFSDGKPVNPDTPGWRPDETGMRQVAAYPSTEQYAVGDLWQPVRGAKATTTPTWPISEGIGTTYRSQRVVSQPTAIVAYAAPEE